MWEGDIKGAEGESGFAPGELETFTLNFVWYGGGMQPKEINHKSFQSTQNPISGSKVIVY